MAQETDLGNMRLLLLPPGTCDIKHRLSMNTFDVNLAHTPHEMALNSDRYDRLVAKSEVIGFFPADTDIRLRVTNTLPGCVLEVDDATLNKWTEVAEAPMVWRENVHGYRTDRVAADLARAAIQYLMHAARSKVPADRLTVEAIALAIAARGIARFSAPDGDVDDEITRWSRTARRKEIDRAIDLIETRLCEADLSIAQLANAARLSSSHFSAIFRSMIGETPYAFILRRRAEYARDLIIGTADPLAEIAFTAGFSSQAHMTVVMRKIFGATPAAMRN
ncbi:AraC family transcriptional regulator [Gymnodinialimonas sp. 2305UL16-5]|uniref:AraC family transcriptional regulator n=1 Tax=Gymnodinialimonas mytili TaxID=3126503 RepID=UPI0030B24412